MDVERAADATERAVATHGAAGVIGEPLLQAIRVEEMLARQRLEHVVGHRRHQTYRAVSRFRGSGGRIPFALDGHDSITVITFIPRVDVGGGLAHGTVTWPLIRVHSRRFGAAGHDFFLGDDPRRNVLEIATGDAVMKGSVEHVLKLSLKVVQQLDLVRRNPHDAAEIDDLNCEKRKR